MTSFAVLMDISKREVALKTCKTHFSFVLKHLVVTDHQLAVLDALHSTAMSCLWRSSRTPQSPCPCFSSWSPSSCCASCAGSVPTSTPSTGTWWQRSSSPSLSSSWESTRLTMWWVHFFFLQSVFYPARLFPAVFVRCPVALSCELPVSYEYFFINNNLSPNWSELWLWLDSSSSAGFVVLQFLRGGHFS